MTLTGYFLLAGMIWCVIGTVAAIAYLIENQSKLDEMNKVKLFGLMIVLTPVVATLFIILGYIGCRLEDFLTPYAKRFNEWMKE